MTQSTPYSTEVVDKIMARLADGESLNSICNDDDMPARVTFYDWMMKGDRGDEGYEDLPNKYARARELQADSLADDIQDIADDGRNDWMEKFDKDGNSIGWQLNGEAVQRSKLRVEARKWNAAKLRPRKYGDKLDLTTGGDKIAPSETEAAVRLAKIAEKYGASNEPE